MLRNVYENKLFLIFCHKVQIFSRYPYVLGETVCILQGLAAETSANATVLTITAFTIERYIAISYPFLSRTATKLRRAVRYIILIWTLSFIFAIPQVSNLSEFTFKYTMDDQ